MARVLDDLTMTQEGRVIDSKGNDITNDPEGQKYLINAGYLLPNSMQNRNKYYATYTHRRNRGDEEASNMKFPEWFEKYNGKIRVEDAPDKGSTSSQLIAAIVGAGNGLLPVSDVQTIAGLFSDDVAERLNKMVEDNPQAARSGFAIGSIVGVIGGPAVLAAKGGKGAVKIGRWIAQGRAKGVTRGQIDDAKKALDEMEVQGKYEKARVESGKDPLPLEPDHPDVKIQAAQGLKAELERFDDAWASLERQTKVKPDVKQDAFRNLTRGLSDENPAKNNLRNPFETIFSKEPENVAHVTGGTIKKTVEEVGNQLGYKAREAILNFTAPFVEALGAFGVDFISNYFWSFDNFIEQGVDEGRARQMAFAYAVDKTPEELAAEVAKKTLGRIPILESAVGITAETLKTMWRLRDVNLETGHVAREKYTNMGGIINRNPPRPKRKGIMRL